MPDPPIESPETQRVARRDLDWLSRVIVRRTTDLLCAMIVIGGLLTVTLQLWPALSVDASTQDSLSDSASQLDSLLEADRGSSLRWRTVTGSEEVAWQVLQAELQTLLEDRELTVPSIKQDFAEDLAEWPAVIDDPQGRWSIRRPPEWPRIAVAVSLRSADPLICGWGMLRANGDGTWSISIIRGPFNEQSALAPERGIHPVPANTGISGDITNSAVLNAEMD